MKIFCFEKHIPCRWVCLYSALLVSAKHRSISITDWHGIFSEVFMSNTFGLDEYVLSFNNMYHEIHWNVNLSKKFSCRWQFICSNRFQCHARTQFYFHGYILSTKNVCCTWAMSIEHKLFVSTFSDLYVTNAMLSLSKWFLYFRFKVNWLVPE